MGNMGVLGWRRAMGVRRARAAAWCRAALAGRRSCLQAAAQLGEGLQAPAWAPGSWPRGLVTVAALPGVGKTSTLLAWARAVVAAGQPLLWLDCDRSLHPGRLPAPAGLARIGCPAAAVAWALELVQMRLAAVVVVDSLQPLIFCQQGGWPPGLCCWGPHRPGAAAHSAAALSAMWCRAKGDCERLGAAVWVTYAPGDGAEAALGRPSAWASCPAPTNSGAEDKAGAPYDR